MQTEDNRQKSGNGGMLRCAMERVRSMMGLGLPAEEEGPVEAGATASWAT
eukprot:COSAG02_NODE_4544_length_5228_cov_8.569117_3_plen_50_part_00